MSHLFDYAVLLKFTYGVISKKLLEIFLLLQGKETSRYYLIISNCQFDPSIHCLIIGLNNINIAKKPNRLL